MLGQEYAVKDVLRLCVPKVHRGDFDRSNVVLRDMDRASVVFDATQRNVDFVTAEEEWCWRSSYIVSLIAIAANKAGSIIVCVTTKGQTKTLADELRSPGRARHARLGWALPAVYAYRSGRSDRAAAGVQAEGCLHRRLCDVFGSEDERARQVEYCPCSGCVTEELCLVTCDLFRHEQTADIVCLDGLPSSLASILLLSCVGTSFYVLCFVLILEAV